MIIDEATTSPAPAKNNPNCRRDRREKKRDCGSEDDPGDEGSEEPVKGVLDIMPGCRNAIKFDENRCWISDLVERMN